MSGNQPWLTLGRDLAYCRTVVTHPAAEVTVATGDRPRGFVVVRMDGCFRGYIQSVAVDESQRSQKVGRRLIAWAEERIFSECPNVFMCVSSFNPRALSLYYRLGYQLVGILNDFIVAGHDELLLRKTQGPLTA